MRIGLDAKRAVFNLTGLGNYSRDVIRILLERYPENQYFLYSPGFIENPRLKFLTNSDNFTLRTPSSHIDKMFESYWRSFRVVRELMADKLDIYHGLSNELPFGIKESKLKTVVTVHDLIFLRYPQTYSFIDRNIYTKKISHCCRTADRIIAISEQTKKDIIHYLDVSEEKIDVVYQGCSPLFKNEMDKGKLLKVKERHKLPDNYILCVGTVEERKNLASLVGAFNLMKDKHDTYLLVVGKKTAYIDTVMQEVNRFNLQDRVIFLQNVDFDDLPAIYRLAKVFVYPSIFEGFGIPIIEAMYSKTPVVTTAGGCFPEAGGPGSKYVDSNNPEQIKSAIEEILDDESLSRSMAESGYNYVQKFNEQKIAEEIMNVYRRVLKN